MTTVPDAPTNVQVSRSNADILVSFTPPDDDGGSAITSYTVTASDGSTFTGPNSPVTFVGLDLGTSYTFTVLATNANGDSALSTPSAAIVPATVPDPPTVLSASTGDASSEVAFSAPGSDGGVPILDYTVTATDTIVEANGGQYVTDTASPLTVENLVNGDAYTFTVTARNEVGSSAASGSSSLVIPVEGVPEAPSGSPIPNAVAYVANKPIGLTQFIDELQAAVGTTVNVSDVVNPDGSNTLWIAPATLASTTVDSVIANHVENPNYGVPESAQAYLAVQQKVLDNPDVVLTDEEKTTAINGLILRVYSLTFNR